MKKIQHEENMKSEKIVKNEKSVVPKKCKMRKCNIKIVQQEKSSTWKEYNTKKVQHEKSAAREKCTLAIPKHEMSAT